MGGWAVHTRHRLTVVPDLPALPCRWVRVAARSRRLRYNSAPPDAVAAVERLAPACSGQGCQRTGSFPVALCRWGSAV
jgi:hypothetical protein